MDEFYLIINQPCQRDNNPLRYGHGASGNTVTCRQLVDNPQFGRTTTCVVTVASSWLVYSPPPPLRLSQDGILGTIALAAPRLPRWRCCRSAIPVSHPRGGFAAGRQRLLLRCVEQHHPQTRIRMGRVTTVAGSNDNGDTPEMAKPPPRPASPPPATRGGQLATLRCRRGQQRGA